MLSTSRGGKAIRQKASGQKTGLNRTLYEAELSLTDPQVRSSRQAVENLLHPDFCETGTSGTVYDRDTMIEMMLEEAPGEVVIRDFEVHVVSADTALVMYRSIGVSGNEARRTSLWTNVRGRWMLRFHQGTKVPNAWGAVS